MTYLCNLPHCITNMATLVQRTLQVKPGAADLRARYIEALVQRQGLPLHQGPGRRFWFHDPEGRADTVIPRGREPFASGYGAIRALCPDEREAALHLLGRSDEILRTLDPRLHHLVTLLVSDVVLAKGERAGSMTASWLLGVVSFLPHDEWHEWDYAERLVHETIHLNLYLGEAIHELFLRAQPEFATARALSAIREGELRPIDGAFHAACVSFVLAYFWHRAGVGDKSASYARRCQDAVRSLGEQRHLLSPYGNAIWSQLQRHVNDMDLSALALDMESLSFMRFPA
jgi:hypothetical protein